MVESLASEVVIDVAVDAIQVFGGYTLLSERKTYFLCGGILKRHKKRSLPERVPAFNKGGNGTNGIG